MKIIMCICDTCRAEPGRIICLAKGSYVKVGCDGSESVSDETVIHGCQKHMRLVARDPEYRVVEMFADNGDPDLDLLETA